MTIKEQPCCYLYNNMQNCSKEVEWVFHAILHPYDLTYSCGKHLEDLLDIEEASKIWYVGVIHSGKEDTQDADANYDDTRQ